MSERAPLIHADRVTKRYGSFTAVDTVSLDVFPGEIVGLLGANGAGRTTLIKNLLGLTVPTEGAVIAFGRLPDRATRGRLGYVPQGLGLWPTLTVAENISFASAAFQAETPTLEPALAAVRADSSARSAWACNANSPSPSPSPTTPNSSSWTSRPPAWSPWPVHACGTPSTTRPIKASPSWSPRTTCKKPSSATASC